MKIGDKVKLIRTDYLEYPRYKDVVGEIIEQRTPINDNKSIYYYHWRIRWPNGGTSAVNHHNLKLANENTYVKYLLKITDK